MLSHIRNFSVRTKITILFVLSSVVLCILTAFVISFYVNFALVEGNINNINVIATEQVHHTAQVIKTNQLFGKMLVTNSLVRDFSIHPDEAKKKVLLDIFSEYTKENVKYLAIYLLDTHGIGLVSTDARFIGEDYSFRDYFKQALSGNAYIDVAIGSTSHQFGYYYSYPVKSADGSVVGVLVVKTNSTEIDDSILLSHLLNTSTVMLTDSFGIILVSNRSERFLKSVGTLSSKNIALITQTSKLLGKEVVPLQYNEVQTIIDTYTKMVTIKIYDAEDKENENISVIKFEDLPFFLVTETGMQSVEDTVISIVVRSIIIFLIGILLVSVFAYRTIIIFISPMSKFQSLSEAIKTGDFFQRIEVETGDEFSELAESMNSMTVSLGDMFIVLHHKVQELKVPMALINSVAKQFNDARESITKLIPDMSIGISLLANESQKITQIIDNLLEEVERMNIRSKIGLDMISTIHRLHIALMPLLFRKEVSLHYDSSDESLNVLVDNPTVIENAIFGILDHVIKHGKKGGAIHISHETTEKYLKTIIVSTEFDSSKDDLLKISIPTSGRMSDKEKGAATANQVFIKDAIEKNGGIVYVESRPIEGTTITVCLPVV